ncbi:MAG: hypothetical protein FJY76_03810, partial [Candidatus Aenigmarchaeota archaeon]|nr:hypothetical protein [Candidatus Aenigmarchaeota archaeon]
MGARTEVAKSNIIFIIGSMGAAILAFVFNVMAANILQPEQFGLFSFTLVVMGFFLVFTDLGISSTITKFTASYLSKNDFGRVRFLLGFFLKVRMLLAAAIAAFMLLLAPQVAAFFGEPSHAAFIRYSAGLLLASVLLDFVNIALGGFKRFKALSALKLFEKTARIIIVLLFVGFAGAAAFGAVAGVAVSALLAGIVGFFVLRGSRSVFSAEPRPMESRLVLNFGFWVMISSTVTAV